jgi:hypothetical protein
MAVHHAVAAVVQRKIALDVIEKIGLVLIKVGFNHLM